MSADASPLATEIRRLIAVAGPMPVSEFMGLCLGHPAHGYYITRDPFGAGGDFTTAPEVSQMFGEMLGLWAVAVWQQMGAPKAVRLIELGPGRGTMMSDALRAVQVMPAFHAALSVHLVETSPALKARQQQSLANLDRKPTWHEALADVPAGPSIILANEFFDALPINQAVKQNDGWHERLVALDGDGRFVYATSPEPMRHFEQTVPRQVREAAPGAIFEWRSDHTVLEIGRRLIHDGGAALAIDYGHTTSAAGDTFQAVRSHSFTDALVAPGDADLTAHVDFEALALSAETIGARVHGPVTQADFLMRLGIEKRAAALKKVAPADKAAEIDAALERLTDRGRSGMGAMFKAIGLSAPSLASLPGLERLDAAKATIPVPAPAAEATHETETEAPRDVAP